MCSMEVSLKMAKMMIICTQLSTKHSSQIRVVGTRKHFSLQAFKAKSCWHRKNKNRHSQSAKVLENRVQQREGDEEACAQPLFVD